jgi:uncharacterized protein
MITSQMDQLFALFYDYVPDMVERRAPHREAHLTRVRAAHDAGDLVIAGALGDPPHGAAIVFRSAEAARRFTDEDPYVSAGLVRAHRIEPWSVVVPENEQAALKAQRVRGEPQGA